MPENTGHREGEQRKHLVSIFNVLTQLNLMQVNSSHFLPCLSHIKINLYLRGDGVLRFNRLLNVLSGRDVLKSQKKRD